MPRSRTGALSSRERLLAAAAREFAADSYEAIAVDRIARTARLNKAMIYYHFGSKAGLYRALVREVYDALFASVERVAATPGRAEDKLRAFIHAIGETIQRYPHFAAVWLRELTAGARHLDPDTLAHGTRVVRVLADILEEGRRDGSLRRSSPLMVQIAAVAPLLMLLVSGSARVRIASAGVPGAADISFDQMLAHVTEATIGALRNTQQQTDMQNADMRNATTPNAERKPRHLR
jgi:TetR/AcrR family transcriptional regulator